MLFSSLSPLFFSFTPLPYVFLLFRSFSSHSWLPLRSPPKPSPEEGHRGGGTGCTLGFFYPSPSACHYLKLLPFMSTALLKSIAWHPLLTHFHILRWFNNRFVFFSLVPPSWLLFMSSAICWGTIESLDHTPLGPSTEGLYLTRRFFLSTFSASISSPHSLPSPLGSFLLFLSLTHLSLGIPTFVSLNYSAPLFDAVRSRYLLWTEGRKMEFEPNDCSYQLK